jgi:hypothetical protein
VEAKSKKDTLKARAKSAATSKQISDMLQGLNSSNAVTAFERMEEKVVALESEAEATLQARAPAGPARALAAPRHTAVQMPQLCMAGAKLAVEFVCVQAHTRCLLACCAGAAWLGWLHCQLVRWCRR